MTPAPATPGVYIQEIPSGVRTITGVPTSICVFLGRTPCKPLAKPDGPVAVHSLSEFEEHFGKLDPGLAMGQAVTDFFLHGGQHAVIVRLRHVSETPVHQDDDLPQDAGPPLTDADYLGDATLGSGLHALRKIDLFNLLCIPPDDPQGDTPPAVYQAALQVCVQRRAILLVDPPAAWNEVSDIVGPGFNAVAALGLTGESARNAALYFPRLLQLQGKANMPAVCVPCGAVAGVIARTDYQDGVWKAPAGMHAELRNVYGVAVRLTDEQNGLINPIGVNALRVFSIGKVIWGARTPRGDDTVADEYKYLPVRRLALHIEESVSRGIAWATFEPNHEPTWSQLRLNVGAFMQALFRREAFKGTTAHDAWFVRCDGQTTTQNDINLGRCNLVIGFAPLKPGEFVLLRISHAMAAATS